MKINYTNRVLLDNRFRFWISSFVFLICALLSFEDSSSKLIPLTILFLTYNLLFSAAHWRAKNYSIGAFISYSLIALDCVMLTASVALSGGMNSPLYVLYLVIFGVCLYHNDWPQFIYSVVFSFLIYAGAMLTLESLNQSYIYAVCAKLIILGVLTGVLYAIMVMMTNEAKKNDRLLSRSKALAHIANVLCGSLSNSRDWIKLVSNLIDKEIQKDGLKCRIVIHKNNHPLLPPSGGKVGIQVPIMVADYIFGALIVTRENKQPLTLAEQDFFSSIAQSMGISLHRAQLWEDFQNQLKRVEAQILLEPESAPKNRTPFSKVDDMIDMVESERKSWVLYREECVMADLLNRVINNLDQKIIDSNVDICVQGPVNEVPAFLGDKNKLVKMLSLMIETTLGLNGSSARIDIHVMLKINDLTLSVRGQKSEEDLGAIPFKDNSAVRQKLILDYDSKLVYCQKVSAAHKGHFWIKETDEGRKKVVGFSLPLEFVKNLTSPSILSS